MNGGLLLREELCVAGRRKQGSAERTEGRVLLELERKNRKKQEIDSAVLLGFSGMVVAALASVVLVPSQSVAAGTEVAYFFASQIVRGRSNFKNTMSISVEAVAEGRSCFLPVFS